jgi:alanine racemase
MALRALARVDTGAIERNCARLAAAASPAALCAVVKADGYGHGTVAAARAALAGGATWLAVATAEEARVLRAAGLDGPLLVLGALSPSELDVALEARADLAAWREDFVAAIAAHPLGAGTGIHVKLDSGLGRLGTRDADEADRVADAAAAAPGLRLAGAWTHFATADEPDPGFLRRQLAVFEPWARAVAGRHDGVLVHAANSAATLAAPATHFDLVRCGIAIYGLDPFQGDPSANDLEPALELRSYVADVKRCLAGGSVGYGRRFVAERDTWIATLPIGYGDGVRRGLGDNGDVLVRGRRYPLVGTISMDNVTIDLGPSDAEPPLRGADAVLIGRDGDERILAEDVARRLRTINYEVTCGISARVPREHR